MGVVKTAGDFAFKTFIAGLGVTTVYLAGTFSVNLYRGISWHNAQSKKLKEEEEESSSEQNP